jgi:hypothetical protein
VSIGVKQIVGEYVHARESLEPSERSGCDPVQSEAEICIIAKEGDHLFPVDEMIDGNTSVDPRILFKLRRPNFPPFIGANRLQRIRPLT